MNIAKEQIHGNVLQSMIAYHCTSFVSHRYSARSLVEPAPEAPGLSALARSQVALAADVVERSVLSNSITIFHPSISAIFHPFPCIFHQVPVIFHPFSIKFQGCFDSFHQLPKEIIGRRLLPTIIRLAEPARESWFLQGGSTKMWQLHCIFRKISGTYIGDIWQYAL